MPIHALHVLKWIINGAYDISYDTWYLLSFYYCTILYSSLINVVVGFCSLLQWERIDSGFHVALPYKIGFTTGQGANVEVPLVAESAIQTSQLVHALEHPWVYPEADSARGAQSMAHGPLQPRMDMDAAQHKIVNLLTL